MIKEWKNPQVSRWIKQKKGPNFRLCQKVTGNNLFLTHDVVHAEGAGAVLQQPGVDTVFVELMSTGDDP